MKVIGRTAALVAVIMLAGCGGEDNSPADPAGPSDSASVASDAPSSPAASSTPNEVSARPYFAALAGEDYTAMMRASKRAAPGSLARAYMIHQANGTNANADAGAETPPGELTDKGSGGFQICYESDDGTDPTCYIYNKFKVTPGGQLASFSLNGRPLTGRVVLGSGKTVDSSVISLTILSAYQTANGYLSVAAKIRSKSTGVIFFDPVATYRAPNGQQRAVASQLGPTNFGARSQGTEVYYFKGPLKFGGTITLQAGADRGNNNYGDTVLVTAKVG